MKIIFAILVVTIISLTAFSQTNQESTIMNLYDAFGKENSLIKDWGFSCIIKYNGKTILFDAGSNANIFESNVTKLGIDIQKIDIVIISHSHFDHTNGIDYLLTKNPKIKIYLPSDIGLGAFPQFSVVGPEPEIKDSIPTYQQYFDGQSTRITVNQSGRYWNANTEYIKESQEILKGVHLVTTRSKYVGVFD
ncbi:MAG TPA: MBL fold metallo-hydrolase, partial [Ignavibacteriaceae bacterium]